MMKQSLFIYRSKIQIMMEEVTTKHRTHISITITTTMTTTNMAPTKIVKARTDHGLKSINTKKISSTPVSTRAVGALWVKITIKMRLRMIITTMRSDIGQQLKKKQVKVEGHFKIDAL